jgi:hypothetical protein
MSTRANIFLPYGKLALYKHFDGMPRTILPVISQVVNESSIFVRKVDGDPKTMMYKGCKKDLMDEMGFLATRIITQFAVQDYRRRASTGLNFEDRDISSIVSPMKICTTHAELLAATYEYYIQKNGDIKFCNVNVSGTPHVLTYKSDMKNALYQLAAIGDGTEDDGEGR